MNTMREVCIIDGRRIPFCKSGTHYMKLSNRELLRPVMSALVNDLGLKGERIGEVSLGAVNKHARDWNMAREATIDAGLSLETPAFDLQKACGTSLETVLTLGAKIAIGQIDSAIAAGTDTNSDLPIEISEALTQRLLAMNYAKTTMEKIMALKGLMPKDLLPKLPAIYEPRTKLSMGQSTEIMAKTWNISREAQDQLALESHQKAARAYEEGFYKEMIVPFQSLSADPLVRANTTLEALAKLKPAFDKSGAGTLTAGNSTSLTDGAAAVFLCSEQYAKERGLPVLARLKMGESAAVDYVSGRDGLLMAPVFAISRMLERANLSLQDFDLYEIHEAFAAQVLCTFKALEDEKFCRERLGRNEAWGAIDRAKLNLKGGSLALGHPFAATGARIVASLAHQLKARGGGRGLISICTAGGMGVTAILEA